MCGIVGFIGQNYAQSTLIKLLKKLEYRGYDSSGVATIKCNKIEVTKQEGFIVNLENKIIENNSNIGIAHTRWATHGVANEINAHPHLSQNKKWAVVHNGIIENFNEIKLKIKNNSNIKFISETDTETIPMLLEFNEKKNESVLSNFINSINLLQGSYAICALNSTTPNTIYLAKYKSPLYITKTSKKVIIASDPICFVDMATQYYCLNDNEFCEATLNSLRFYDKNQNLIEKAPTKLDIVESNETYNIFPHYMLKEIHEIPEVLKRIHNTYLNNNPFNLIDKNFVKTINKIYFIGCGTAYHASCMGEKYIEKFARIESRAFIASEFRYQNPIIDKKTMCIFVSQSGETADTLNCLEIAKQKGAKCIALTNVLYSTLAKNVEIVFPVCAGPEKAVASTKAYNAQICILYMFSRHLQNVKYNLNYNYIYDIKTIISQLILPQKNELIELAKEITYENFAFFIGRDFDYITCKEASLKLKEITYINCEAYPSGELKHGFLALINYGTYVFVLATEKKLLDKTLNAAQETYARGAKVILITQLDLPKSKTDFVHKLIKLQNFEEDLMPIVCITYFQLLSYLVSTQKGINPDKPRNLAKSVTVE